MYLHVLENCYTNKRKRVPSSYELQYVLRGGELKSYLKNELNFKGDATETSHNRGSPLSIK